MYEQRNGLKKEIDILINRLSILQEQEKYYFGLENKIKEKEEIKNNIESNITILEIEEKRISKNIKENTYILQEICTKKTIISEEIKELEQVRENENKKLFEQKQKNKEDLEQIEIDKNIKINEKEEIYNNIKLLKNELSDYKNTIKYTKENDIQEIEKNKIYLKNIKDEINIKEQEKKELIENIKEIEEVYKGKLENYILTL